MAVRDEELVIAPAWRARLEAAGLRRGPDFVEGRHGTLSREDPYRENRVLEVDGQRLFLKVFHYSALYTTWWGIKRLNMPSLDGLAELEAHRALAAHGIPTPEPVAGGRYKRGMFGRGSFFLSADVRGRPLDDVLRAGVSPRVRRRLCERVGELAGKLHRAGWVHRDLYLCHLFVPDAAPPGELPLVVIDLQRARPATSLRARVKDLAALYHSAPGSTRLEQLRVMRRYGLLQPRPRLLARIRKKARGMG